MKTELFFAQRRRALPVMLLAVGTVWNASSALAMDAKKAQASFIKTPLMKGVKVQDFKAAGTEFTAQLGTKKLPVLIFNTGSEAKPVWNTAFYPKSLKLKDIYKTGASALIGGIALENPAVVVSSAKSTKKLSELPKTVQDGITKIFGKSIKNVTYPAGVNFSFTVDPKKTVGLQHLKTALGVADKKAAMAGTMGADFFRHFVNGKAATKKTDMAGVSLATALPKVTPKVAPRSFTAPGLVMSFRGAKDGTVQLVGGGTFTVLVDKLKLTFRAGLRFDPKAKNADTKMFTIFGPTAKKLSKPVKLGAINAQALNLNAAVMGNRQLAVAFSGSTDKKKPFALTAKIDKQKIVLEETFPENMTVRDALGYSQQALDKVKFRNPKKIGNVTTGIVKLAGSDMEAFVFKPTVKADKPYLALVPKQFSFSSWIPATKGTPLDAAKVDKAALLVTPTGGGGDRALRELPKLVADKLVGVVGSKPIKANKNKLPIADGVNLYTRVDVNKSNIMKFLFDKAQIKDKFLTFVGSVNPVVFWVLPEKAGAQLKENKKVHEEILKTLRLATTVTRPQIPGVDKFIEIGPGILRFRGDAVYDRMGARTDVGDVEVVTEIVSKIKVKLPGKTIPMAGQINFHKGIADKSFEFKVIGTSTYDWKKAFDIPFLTLNDIELAATLNVDKNDTHTFVAGLGSKTKIGSQEVKSSIELVFEKKDQKKKGKTTGKKTWQVEDLVLSVPGEIALAKLPGVGAIPGIKDFVIKDYTLSRAATQGTLLWKTIGYKGQAAMVSIEGKYTLFAKFPDLNLKKLLKNMPKPMDALAELKMPRAVLAFSTQKLTGYELVNLPDAARDMLKDIIQNESNEVPIWDGVTLIGAIGEKDLPKPLHKIIAEDLGVFKVIDGDLVLAGGVNGIFGGNPKIGLYADLPGFKFPANQPWSRLVSFERAKANFFIRADAAATMLNLGVGGEMQLQVPHLDNPKKVDKLKFRGEGYVSADAVSAAGGVKVAGRMEGQWREPFGLKNFAFENPAILVGADSEGSVEFGVGTTVEYAARKSQKLRFAGDFVTNINFSSTFPIPKKLGVRMQAKKMSHMAQLEIADAMIRGVMTGPMAKVVTQALADPVARKSAQYLQKELAKRSLIDILQIEKLPVPYVEFRDVDLFFATPGAVIPGREDTLVGMGMVVAGKMSVNLMGQRYPIGEMDNRLTFKDGLKIYGKIEPRNLGPLKLKKALIDVAANIESLPHFKIKSDVDLLGTTEKLDIEVSKDKIGFFYDKDLGPIIKTRIDAKTVGKDLFRVRDFVVTAKTTTSVDKLITKEVFPRMGIPKVISDIIVKSTPLYIDGGSFNGSLTEFVKGGAVTLKLDHKFFGQRMDPAVITVKPVWSDPHKAFPSTEIARELTKSFLVFLGTNPVNLPPVNLGLVKIDDAKLTALLTNPKDPKFVVQGKTSVLGASRAVDVSLSDKGYAFKVKDRIAGGLWDANYSVRSVGGTTLAPNDIRYFGTVSSDFYTWLQKSVGGQMNKGFDAVNRGYERALRDLRAAENKVRGINALIESKRRTARRQLEDLRSLIRSASKALGRARSIFDRARDVFNWLRNKRIRIERRGWFPFKGAVVWGAKKAEWGAEEVLKKAEDGLRAAQRGLNNLAAKEVPLDLHPLVAPLIVAREVAVGTLRGVQVAFAGAQGLNNTFKNVTNSLINAAAGAKVLVVKRAIFQGSLREARSEFHMTADILGQKNVYTRMNINLLKPQETNLRDLAMTISAVIRGEKIEASRGSLPEPPALPVATFTKADFMAAKKAAIEAKLKLIREAQAKKAAQERQLAAATQPKPTKGTPDPRFRNMYIGVNNNAQCLDTWPRGGPLGAIRCQAHGNLRFTFWSDDTIRHDPQDRCLNVQSGGANGAPVVVARCDNHSDQKWTVAWSGGRGPSDVDPTWRFRIVHKASGRCLEASGERTRSADCVGSSNADTWSSAQTFRASRTVPKPIVGRPDPVFRNMYLATNNNAQCLDASPSHTAPVGSRTGCINHGNLRFTFWSDDTIRQDPRDLCLNVQRGGASGAPVVLANCVEHPDQKWTVRWSGRGPSRVDPTWRFQMVHKSSGRCLTLEANGAASTRDCAGGSNADNWRAAQTWRASKSVPKLMNENNTFRRVQLVNARSGQCADESSGKLTRGGPVIMWGCNSGGASRERQLFSHNQRGQITTTNGLCLDVESPDVRRGTKMILWGCNGSATPKALQRQRWRRLADGRLQHIQSGMCLDATDNARQRGRLVLSTCSTTATQKWRVRGASS